MTLYEGELITGAAQLYGFSCPLFDESTTAVVRLTRNGNSHDYELTYNDEQSLSVSADVPDDIKAFSLGVDDNISNIRVQDYPDSDILFEVISLDHDGSQVYP